MISCIVPCYNEEVVLEQFYQETQRVVSQMENTTFEYIFVDDGSRDHTLDKLKELAERNEQVYYLSFSRNFGKEAAIYAGLEYASGEYAVIMDADLQDPPALLPHMYELLQKGEYDCIGTRRVTRKGEPPIRSFFARCFYRLINKMSRTEVVDGARDYQMMTRQVADAILSMGEYNRFSKGIFGWVGYRRHWLEYENIERAAGESKWNFWTLFLYAIDGIIAFSTLPLSLASCVGVLCFVLAILLILVIIVKTLVIGDPTSGWPSMACLILMLSGIQLFCMGILGEYLARTYLETKHRPIYLLRETNKKSDLLAK